MIGLSVIDNKDHHFSVFGNEPMRSESLDNATTFVYAGMTCPASDQPGYYPCAAYDPSIANEGDGNLSIISFNQQEWSALLTAGRQATKLLEEWGISRPAAQHIVNNIFETKKDDFSDYLDTDSKRHNMGVPHPL